MVGTHSAEELINETFIELSFLSERRHFFNIIRVISTGVTSLYGEHICEDIVSEKSNTNMRVNNVYKETLTDRPPVNTKHL